MMLWTQNAWAIGHHREAAYQCMNGHVMDPMLTRECPSCGLHDTSVLGGSPAGQVDHLCHACDTYFSTPR
jgi:transposase-like protein